MSTHTRRVVIGVATIAVLAALARFNYLRFLGESATYPACVAAMEAVAVGQPWSEAEARIVDAVANGAQRWEPWADVPAHPTPDVVAHPTADVLALLTAPATDRLEVRSVQVTCVRYDPDLASSDDDAGGIVPAVRMWWQMTEHGAFNYTRFEIDGAEDRVSAVTARDCNMWPIDIVECREHGAPPGKWGAGRG
jgi:hypothetical protein